MLGYPGPRHLHGVEMEVDFKIADEKAVGFIDFLLRRKKDWSRSIAKANKQRKKEDW